MFAKLSDYARQLGEANKKYLDKIAVLKGTDPYSLSVKTFILALDSLPKITTEAITDFLIFRISSESQKDIRAYKSLDAFARKWVEDIKAQEIRDCLCIIGKVMHSQKVNEPSLNVWITLFKSGQILNCHCMCVAGLEEACTHAAAILFALEYAGKQEQSVTDVLAYWIGPKTKKQFHKKIVDTTFQLPQRVLQSGDKDILPVAMGAVPEMADTEDEEFLKLYREDGGSCVLHTYFKESVASRWPDLSQLFEEQFVNKTLEELLAVGEGLCLDITDETLINIEEATRNQAKCNLWFALRAGRVTASNFRAVCATRVQKPSISLLGETGQIPRT
ncbi:hypothetical protein PPYR_04552 [Photinus pyralis]|uniref:SWIM-type domain-containing protein n=3 Tax=Photinus pyralis TaxID=7054 RepID=A0A5N4AYH0_PHOPY|nr:hypothetical protein PPYR_04552 [Photinus pyralis]